MNSLSPDQLNKINWLIRHWGQQAKHMASGQFQVFEKGIEDYVTTVDRLLDEQLAAGFAALFPQDGIVTEENVQSRGAFHENYSQLWFIDPIDGTDDFIHGRDYYAVMVGLLQAAQPKAGWVYAPAFDQLYFGGPNWGLFQTKEDSAPEPLIPTEPPPPSTDFCPVIMGDKDQRNFGEAIAQLIPEIQVSSVGSFGLKVMQVICGHAGLYVYFNGRVKLWDTTGPVALAKAAGLVCCDLDGEPLQFTPDVLDSKTLAHHQPILIGWPSYVEPLRSRLQQAVTQGRRFRDSQHRE
ncbi:MAG TPA: inositol monophosphatase family protein [Crinalium sp.]|jgi:3'(2'), 5'-bisphosphate nucleotidase